MNRGYKQTEVGVIPEDWEVKPLKRISPKQSVGLVINPSTYFDSAGTVPLLVVQMFRKTPSTRPQRTESPRPATKRFLLLASRQATS
jgi:hypothetical protein